MRQLCIAVHMGTALAEARQSKVDRPANDTESKSVAMSVTGASNTESNSVASDTLQPARQAGKMPSDIQQPTQSIQANERYAAAWATVVG